MLSCVKVTNHFLSKQSVMKPMVIIDLEFLVPGRLCAFLIMIILIFQEERWD